MEGISAVILEVLSVTGHWLLIARYDDLGNQLEINSSKI